MDATGRALAEMIGGVFVIVLGVALALVALLGDDRGWPDGVTHAGFLGALGLTIAIRGYRRWTRLRDELF